MASSKEYLIFILEQLSGLDDIPAFDWAVFPCKGAMPNALQDVNTKIYTEWLPALKEYEFAAGYCVEYYDDPTKYEKGT